jgi:hypothetical protein
LLFGINVDRDQAPPLATLPDRVDICHLLASCDFTTEEEILKREKINQINGVCCVFYSTTS